MPSSRLLKRLIYRERICLSRLRINRDCTTSIDCRSVFEGTSSVRIELGQTGASRRRRGRCRCCASAYVFLSRQRKETAPRFQGARMGPLGVLPQRSGIIERRPRKRYRSVITHQRKEREQCGSSRDLLDRLLYRWPWLLRRMPKSI